MKLLLLMIIGLPVIFIAVRAIRRRRTSLNPDLYGLKWKEIQGLCKDRSNWQSAIIQADKLLSKALRKRRFKGKSMGERMVSAQRVMTNNDSMWMAHNLAKKVIIDPAIRLRENDVKAALIGFRQSLKDLGALQSKPLITPEPAVPEPAVTKPLSPKQKPKANKL